MFWTLSYDPHRPSALENRDKVPRQRHAQNRAYQGHSNIHDLESRVSKLEQYIQTKEAQEANDDN